MKTLRDSNLLRVIDIRLSLPMKEIHTEIPNARSNFCVFLCIWFLLILVFLFSILISLLVDFKIFTANLSFHFLFLITKFLK